MAALIAPCIIVFCFLLKTCFGFYLLFLYV